MAELNTDVRRILFIKPSSLGDIVHALPTLTAIRSRFPRTHITWLVKRQWTALVERAEGVDRVWPIDSGLFGWVSEVPALRATQFDLAVDLQGLFRSAATAWLAGCPVRIGFANGREGSPWFYTRRVPVPPDDMHAVDRYLLVAKALGAQVPAAPEFRFRIPADDRSMVANVLKRHGMPEGAPWIALNVSARWPTKRWPLASFASVANELQKEGVGPVVLIGGFDDKAEAQAISGMMPVAPIDLTGETSVGLLPALLSSASLLITNDSGPMHVAAAVGTPVVALFGPTSPVRTGPYGAGHRVLTHELPCRPCFSRRCRNAINLECLTSISPTQVLQAVRDQLAVRLPS